jgi:hypothetical protein
VIPEPLRYQMHPLWSDPAAIRARFPQYVIDADVSALRLRLAYFAVLGGPAADHGFMRRDDPHAVDWDRLRTEGAGPTPAHLFRK